VDSESLPSISASNRLPLECVRKGTGWKTVQKILVQSTRFLKVLHRWNMGKYPSRTWTHGLSGDVFPDMLFFLLKLRSGFHPGYCYLLRNCNSQGIASANIGRGIEKWKPRIERLSRGTSPSSLYQNVASSIQRALVSTAVLSSFPPPLSRRRS